MLWLRCISRLTVGTGVLTCCKEEVILWLAGFRPRFFLKRDRDRCPTCRPCLIRKFLVLRSWSVYTRRQCHINVSLYFVLQDFTKSLKIRKFLRCECKWIECVLFSMYISGGFNEEQCRPPRFDFWHLLGLGRLSVYCYEKLNCTC